MKQELTIDEITKATSLYLPNWRFIRRAVVDFPHISAIAYVGDTNYTTEALEHLAGIEAQACINQVAYVAGYAFIKEGRIPEITPETFLSHAKDHMLIAESLTKIKFKEIIHKGPEILIEGEVFGLKKIEDKYFAFMNFNFEGGKIEASMKFVIRY